MRYGASLRLDVVKERLGREAIRTTINIYGHLLPNVDAALADAPFARYSMPTARRQRHERRGPCGEMRVAPFTRSCGVPYSPGPGGHNCDHPVPGAQ
jgi:hypothetical protein